MIFAASLVKALFEMEMMVIMLEVNLITIAGRKLSLPSSLVVNIQINTNLF